MSVIAYCHRRACTVSPEDTLRDAAQRMEKESEGLLVVLAGERPVGVLTDRDVALYGATEGRDARRVRVADAMSRPVVSVRGEAPLEEAVSHMSRSRLRRLPVVDRKARLAGVLASDDLVRLLAAEIGGLAQVLAVQLPAGAAPPAGQTPRRGAWPRRAEHYHRPVVSAAAETPVARLAEEMDAQVVGSVVVLGPEERAAGIVTDRDIALRVIAPGRDPATTPASSIMSAPLVAAEPDQPIEEILAKMSGAGVRRIPILREGRAVGIVSFDDLLVLFGRELDRLGRGVAEEVRAARLRSYPARVRREVEDRLEEAAGQLRELGDQTLRALGREIEAVMERVVGSARRRVGQASPLAVGDLMQRDVATCTPDDTLGEAARIMWERDCGCVPVVASDGSGVVTGMITDRDIAMAALTRGARLSDLAVRTAMATRVHACRSGDTLEEAEAVMRAARVRRLPVVDAGGRLHGILSLADLARATSGDRNGERAVPAPELAATLRAICQPSGGESQPSGSARSAPPRRRSARDHAPR
jgi:CBS domain-containing protein